VTIEPQPLYDAIGRVVLEAAGMESQLGDLISAVSLGPLTVYLTRGQPFAVLEQMLKALIDNDHVPEPLHSQVREARSEAIRLHGRRNAIVHGTWLPGEAPGQFTAFRPGKYRLSGTPHAFSIDEMHDLAHDLAVLAMRMFMLAWNVEAQQSGMPPQELFSVTALLAATATFPRSPELPSQALHRRRREESHQPDAYGATTSPPWRLGTGPPTLGE
jgi:hypothetical protein